MERFWSKVEKTDGCWNWIASCTPQGYGKFFLDGRLWLSHRVSFLWSGENIDGSLVLHKCNNKKCVNPDHLYRGDHRANMRDAMRDGLWQIGHRNKGLDACHAAKLTPADVRKIRTGLTRGRTQKDISIEFGIHPNTVGKIKNGRLWAFVS